MYQFLPSLWYNTNSWTRNIQKSNTNKIQGLFFEFWLPTIFGSLSLLSHSAFFVSFIYIWCINNFKNEKKHLINGMLFILLFTQVENYYRFIIPKCNYVSLQIWGFKVQISPCQIKIKSLNYLGYIHTYNILEESHRKIQPRTSFLKFNSEILHLTIGTLWIKLTDYSKGAQPVLYLSSYIYT